MRIPTTLFSKTASVLLLLQVLWTSTEAQGLPPCALSCVTNTIPSSCNLDPACICNSTGFISTLSCCVFASCSASDQSATLAYLQTLCSPVGVNIASLSCSNSPGTSSASSAAASVATSSATSQGSTTKSILLPPSAPTTSASAIPQASRATPSTSVTSSTSSTSNILSTTSISTSYTQTTSSLIIGSSAAPHQSNTDNNGLSPGTKAGIGIGAGLGACILILVAFWFGRRSRRRQGPENKPDTQEGGAQSEKKIAQLDDDVRMKNSGTSAVELEAQKKQAELASNVQLAELEAEYWDKA